MELIVVLDTNAYSDWRRSGRWHPWIAAVSYESAGRLISRDAHFDFLPQVVRVVE